jgi:hypothetical protein
MAPKLLNDQGLVVALQPAAPRGLLAWLVSWTPTGIESIPPAGFLAAAVSIRRRGARAVMEVGQHPGAVDASGVLYVVRNAQRFAHAP